MPQAFEPALQTKVNGIGFHSGNENEWFFRERDNCVSSRPWPSKGSQAAHGECKDLPSLKKNCGKDSRVIDR
jgi:hypothetical protein